MTKLIDKLNDLAYELSEYSNSTSSEIEISLPIEYYYAINEECHNFMWTSTQNTNSINPFDMTIYTSIGITFIIKLKE